MALPKSVLAFDGEGQNDNYILLADSDGWQVLNRQGLSIEDGLRFLTRRELQDRICMWYSFAYDINMLLKGLGDVYFWGGQRGLIVGAYRIRYYPKKILIIETSHHRYTHYDIFGFFQTSFVHALEKWLKINDALIIQGKQARSYFDAWPLEKIIEYNRRELEYLRQLGEKVVEIFSTLDVDLQMKSWHGAGAGAQAALVGIHLDEELSSDPRLNEMIAAAYYGGRIEMIQRGQFFNGWTADIRSAYPAGMLALPDLSRAAWKKTSQFDPYHLGLYQIQFQADECLPFAPFPVRRKNGSIVYPYRQKGCYWSWEIGAALVTGCQIKILRGYRIEGAINSRLNALVQQLYRLRLSYRYHQDGREKAIKLILNSLYGKLAQKQHGRYHSLALAGMITSQTRSQLLITAIQNPENVIGFATDSIFSTSKLSVVEGEALGDWELKDWQRGRFVMNGLYALTGNAPITKMRGYETRPKIFEKLLLDLLLHTSAKVIERRFVTNKLHLAQPHAYPLPCTWIDVIKIVDPQRDGKRLWLQTFGLSPQTSLPQAYEDENTPYEIKMVEAYDDLLLDEN